MTNPEYQQEFNDIIECIKEGTYKEEALNLSNKGLITEDAAELCEAMRVATEAGICNITKLDLSWNQLNTIDVAGLIQLETLLLSNNQLATIQNIECLTQLKRLCLSNKPAYHL